jgi:hypothetical protein
VGLGRGLEPEEYKFLAEHYDFTAFTGGAIDREYRSNNNVTFEKVVTKAARTVKQHNPEAKVLIYWGLKITKGSDPGQGLLVLHGLRQPNALGA